MKRWISGRSAIGLVVPALLFVLASAWPAAAQEEPSAVPTLVVPEPPSLAEIARQEQLRRKTVKGSSKVYTDKDLRRGSPGQAPATGSGSSSGAAGSASSGSAGSAAPPRSTPVPDAPSPAGGGADSKAKNDADKNGEETWRGRMNQAREALRRNEVFAEALQTRINALTSDFVGRDDPSQRAKIGEDRVKALAELDRVKAEIESCEEADRRHRRGGAQGRRSSRLAPLTSTSRPRVPAPAQILLVEDKDSLRTMLRHALERQGHAVLEARDQPEAVRHPAAGAAGGGPLGSAPARRRRLRRAARLQGDRRRRAGHRHDGVRQHRGRRDGDEGRGDRLPRQAGRSRPSPAPRRPRARAAPHRDREPADEGGAGGPPRRAAARRRGSVAAQGVRLAAAGGRDRHDGAARRGERDRQGAVRAVAARAQPARRRAVCRDQLRRDSRDAARDGALRPREGGVHRGRRAQARQVRDGAPRHAVPRRDRRPAARAAGEDPARARGAPLRTGRRHRARAGGRPARRRDQQGAAGGGRRAALPRGPLLPPVGLPDHGARRCANAAATSRCWRATSSIASAAT